MNLQKTKTIFIIGPTASGKTFVAHKIFEKFNISLISMDSMQVYKYMDIGTSKPSAEERKKYNYYGIDIVEPDTHFSTGDYIRYCKSFLNKIKNLDKIKEKKIPLFVGGTGLYFDALTKGFDDIPKANMEIRKKLQNKIELNGIGSLYNELKEVDIEYALKISETDSKRIIRALEVYYLTGKPFSSFHKTNLFLKDKSEDSKNYDINGLNVYNSNIYKKKDIPNLKNEKLNKNNHYLKIGIYLPREILYTRINKRVDEMILNGFIDEVQFLYNKYKNIDVPAFKAIGYSHFFNYFSKREGYKDLNHVIDLIKRDTRRYAKRQFTWFKRDKEIIWINMENIDKSIDKILKIVNTYINQINSK